MRIDVLTLFPEAFAWFAGQRHVRNALERARLRHARRLLDLGLGGDVAFCCEVDAGVSVPELTRWEGLPAFTG